MITVKHVPLEWVNRAWIDVEKYVESAVKHSKGDYTTQQVKAFVTSGQWSLLVAVEGETVIGCATISFYNRPNDRVALVTAIGGRMIANTDTFKQLKIFAESNGATVIEGAARESIARLWRRHGFTTKYQIVEVRLA